VACERVAVVSVVFATLLLALTGTTARAVTLEPRVIGGEETTIERVPWQALVYVNKSDLCGGAIIASDWILTAAHCLSGGAGSSVEVFTGATSTMALRTSNQRAVAATFIHPAYDSVSFDNDLALIRLAKPIEFSSSQQTIALPVGLDSAVWPTLGAVLAVSGWGATAEGGTSSVILKRADVSVLAAPGAPCGDYGSSFNAAMSICAGAVGGGVDACQGDSGGPLVSNANGTPVLAGLVSVGQGCGGAAFPGVYTRVSTALDWIRQYLPVAASPPGSPLNIRVGSVKKKSALVTWSPMGEAATGYVVTAGTRSCYTAATRCTLKGISGKKIGVVTVVAFNAAGQSLPVNANN
jgi:secreted trypsin-like serine protease